jgi:hypothetical protein
VQFSWISDGRGKIVAIVGICKNAGKTTVLNALIRQYSICWGVLSTGRDGETEDLLFKTPKPRVQLPSGSLFCCDQQTLEGHGSRISILAKVKWHKGNRSLWLARADADLDTEITGPGTAAAQLDCAWQLLNLGAEKVLIDGSLDRKSIVLNKAVDVIILVAGASFGSTQSIISELNRLMSLARIKQYNYDNEMIGTFSSGQEIMLKFDGKWTASGLKSLFVNDKEITAFLERKPEAIYIPGAFSDHVYQHLSHPLEQIELIFRHPECLKLDKTNLESLLSTHKVSCLIPFPIQAIAVNAHGVGKNDIPSDELLWEIKRNFPGLPVIDVMELSE